MTFTRELQLRFAEIDYIGHLTTSAYAVLFDETRTAWLSSVLDEPFPRFVIAHQELHFQREVLLADSPVTIAVELEHVGERSLRAHETLRVRSGEVHAVSQAVLVMWDTERRSSRPLTERERSCFGRLLQTGYEAGTK